MRENLLDKEFTLSGDQMTQIATKVQIPSNHPKVCPNPQDMP